MVQQWKRAAPALARARAEELRRWRYDPATVEALLDIGARSPRRADEPNGLVEMQRLFMKAARKQGRLPHVVEEAPAVYSIDGEKPAPVRALGDPAILARPRVALFCSVRCPGKLILETYDLARRFRADGVLVISPFHSPMEQECLRILLRPPGRAIWCLARGFYRKVPGRPVDGRRALTDGRLLMVTAFPDTVRRITTETATIRNRLTADMADAVVVAHAAPGSKMEALCRAILAAGRPLYTFAHPANAALLDAGARRIDEAGPQEFKGAGGTAGRG